MQCYSNFGSMPVYSPTRSNGIIVLPHPHTRRTTVSQGQQLQRQCLELRRFCAYFPHFAPILSPPSCLFPGTILYYTIDSHMSLPNGRVTPLVRKLLHHCPMRHQPTMANVMAIAPSYARLFHPVSLMDDVSHNFSYIAWSIVV
jgi:hypothetical protein